MSQTCSPKSCSQELMNERPQMNISLNALGYTSGRFLPYTAQSQEAVFEEYFYGITSNLLQAVHAAVRFDIGNIQPNNFLVNPSVINNTFFSSQNTLWADRVENATTLFLPLALTDLRFNASINLPLPLPQEDVDIKVPYLCHFTDPKPIGEAFISVSVATLTTLATIWTVTNVILTFFAKRGRREGKDGPPVIAILSDI